MKVAIIGGTGSLGRGLGLRLSKRHEVLIGSRDPRKGDDAAKKLKTLTGREILGGSATEVSAFCDAAVLAMPYDPEGSLLKTLRGQLAGKLVVSPIVPMKVEKGLFIYALSSGSAAEQAAAALSESRVAAAIHTVPAPLLLDENDPLDFDALVAADDRPTFEVAASLIRDIGALRPLYAGGLSQARLLEAQVPLLLNLARLNGLRNPSVRFV